MSHTYRHIDIAKPRKVKRRTPYQRMKVQLRRQLKVLA